MKTLLLLMFCSFCTSLFAQVTPAKEPRFYLLKLKVVDSETSGNLEGSFVKVFNKTKQQLVDSVRVQNGYAKIKLEKGNDYDIIARFDEYLTRRANFNAACYLLDSKKAFCVSGIMIENVTTLANQNELIEATINMQKINLNDIYRIDNIHYDFNKWEIKKEAFQGLYTLIQILKDNPDIKVELGSHTDSRADEEYNMSLSQKRAAQAVNFIIIKGGIAQERIIAKGYGETQLLNQCKDGVVCSEKEHAINRRTEVKVLGYKNSENINKLQKAGAISGAKN
ncbi:MULTISPECIES: OmpA family protein [unclassified Arcicella]|uniref:OmpA family protein n=1 Tax=unclassified Arcicella TaxID=2644986 RepID=UPI00285A1F6D|nr:MULTISPECIES: OmpA family protein [unclassified Arcicella]MDR6563314.1 outer membrane protein OmpA-like peptidoglycan-associated protein [Arcicella sp. BE51]MDR6813265.1 outer membrane protein OmpA-like peptidoglycan-associated protein [Arcicella sp. BE140]MDR6824579.1 outer membrane protein OmpA-like peptidoglycan-associated protein [Arcicella sp. BE139]